MNVEEAIGSRRSIRKFKRDEIPADAIEKIIEAGIDAPSPKNRQPWKFILITEKSKKEMINALREGIDAEEKQHRLLPGSAMHLCSARRTVDIMEEAPLTIFIENFQNRNQLSFTLEEKLFETANVQCIGASIENMILTAESMGIGSLWICDIYFAYDRICSWLKTDNEIIAAVSFGFPDERPPKRPRKRIEACTEWR
ncbi:MAG: nitroreductase family protein [Fibrobacteraceae bacterium]